MKHPVCVTVITVSRIDAYSFFYDFLNFPIFRFLPKNARMCFSASEDVSLSYTITYLKQDLSVNLLLHDKVWTERIRIWNGVILRFPRELNIPMRTRWL